MMFFFLTVLEAEYEPQVEFNGDSNTTLKLLTDKNLLAAFEPDMKSRTTGRRKANSIVLRKAALKIKF